MENRIFLTWGCRPAWLWPQAHFEICPSLEQAAGAGNGLHASQIAYPETACAAVYEASAGLTAGVGV